VTAQANLAILAGLRPI